VHYAGRTLREKPALRVRGDSHPGARDGRDDRDLQRRGPDRRPAVGVTR
jgi:hypothetical protein